MKRKVNRVGTRTLTVSLPSKWVEQYGLKKGSEVDLVERGNSLEIFSESSYKLNKISIKVDHVGHSYLRAIISNAYKKGYDEIEVLYEKEDLTREVQKIVDTLLGLEMMEVDGRRCVLKNVASGLESEYDGMLRKIFNLVMETSKRVKSAVEKNQFDEYDNINYVRFTVTKHADFCKRLLNKNHRNDECLIFRYMLVHILEKISNQYDYIYKFGHEQKPKKFSKDCRSYLSDATALLELFFHAYYSKDRAKIKEINARKDKLLFKELYNLRLKATPDDVVVIHYASAIIRHCVDLTGPFFALSQDYS